MNKFNFGAMSLISGLALSLSAAPLLAATFNFSQAPDIQGPSLSQTVGSVTLTATGYSYTPTTTIGGAVTLGAQADVIIQNQGLGVCDNLSTSPTSLAQCGQPLVDAIPNNGGPELAKFTFSKAINVLSVSFNQNDQNDDVDLFAGTPLSFYLRDTTSLSGGPTGDVISLAGNAAFQGITMFGVGLFDHPTNGPGNTSDQVRIASITFEIAAVPVPAGAVLMLTALGGLGFARKRKS